MTVYSRRTFLIGAGAGVAAVALAAPAEAASKRLSGKGGGPPVTVTRTGEKVVLANGYLRAAFDLRYPQISELSADFHGRGDYGADLTQSGEDPLQRSGIVLERTDPAAPRVLTTVGITDPDHRGAGGFPPSGMAFSYAAELLPPGGQVVTPSDDAADDVPMRLPDTSGATPNVATARGQVFELPAADGGVVRVVHVFGASTDGTGTGTFTLRFADGTTEDHSVTLPDWGSGPAEPHAAFTMAYRHTGTGNDAQVPFHVFHVAVPVGSTAALTAVTFPDGVANRSTSVYPTQLQVLGLSFEAPDGTFATPALGWNDAPPGSTDHASSAGAGPDLATYVLDASDGRGCVRVDGVIDDPSDPLATSSWTLSLERGSRTLDLQVDAHALRDGEPAGLRISYGLAPQSAYGLFAHRGVTQRMNSDQRWFASDDDLHRFFSLGGGGSVDVTATGHHQTVLRSAPPAAATPGDPTSGLEQVLVGSYPTVDAWDGAGWTSAEPAVVRAGDSWSVQARITPNNYDFPAATVPDDIGLPFEDLRALLTGVYGSAVGVLDTYAFPGAVAPTLATPGRAYGDGNSFFDPDAWETCRALVYSGDRYLQRQAQQIIERSGAAILPSGQIPHHFNGAEPTYVAISGATQTGPNIFWIQSAFDYAGATGDYAWLRSQMPRIEQALTFITDRYDADVRLISAPGPLWIDVFIRENYTADTNAFMVGLLRRAADAEALVGDADLAERRRALARDIAEGMNAHLWLEDHYVTQLNPDGTRRDLVDYDANLLAVAFGVAPADRAKRILDRVDAGPCTHGRATWVSEQYYGPNDTYGGNTGDSATAMGRIGWADAHARRRVGDLAAYRDEILDPLRADLLQRTWLTERYDCAGNAIRVPYYHEYPELVAMLLREITYGIELGLGTVTIDPFGTREYHYHVGDVKVDYSARTVDISAPGSGERAYDVHGLTANARYVVVAAGPDRARPQTVRADELGTLRFTAPVGTDTTIRIRWLD